MATKKAKKKTPPHAPVNAAALPSTDEVTFTIRGSEKAMKRLLDAMRFEEGEWNPDVTTQIALDMTFTKGATVFDELGGPKLRMNAPELRTAYRDRCVLTAEKRGHAIDDPANIPSNVDTTVSEVGDALFNHSR